MVSSSPAQHEADREQCANCGMEYERDDMIPDLDLDVMLCEACLEEIESDDEGGAPDSLHPPSL